MYKYKILLSLTIFVFAAMSFKATAKNGYKIKVNFTDVKEDTKLLLCHYYGKGGTVFRDDSVMLKNGQGTFNSKEKIEGGIYILLFKDQSASMEMILLNGDDFSITAEKKSIIPTVQFKGRSENPLFYKYQVFLLDYSQEYTALNTQLQAAKNKKDSTNVTDKMKEKAKELTAYRTEVIKNNPNVFLSKLFKALAEPDVPEYKDWPLNEEGKKDSTFPSQYYKAHYWDEYDFDDERLVYTPMYEPKLQNYMDRWVVPFPDSVKAECDMILSKAEGKPETFKYSLWYLTRWAETSKIMGMDEAFVYLVEEYYLKGKATWLDAEQLQKYIKRAEAIAPNMIGQPAMDIRVRNMANEITPLSSVNAKYTLLVFYEADCGHCKKELPKLDSLMKFELYKYGVQIFAVESSNLVENWHKIVKDNKLNIGWIHTYDPQQETNFRAFYDVIVTPTIYLLDENKTIVAKRINHSNVLDVIKHLEEKKAKDK